ncbi:AMP-binding protein [Coxiella burnetii]|uniref:AMP-binding protein n=1 Tax=Coxiella burnetii TaxID=777 RepID=UPI003314C033
MSESEYKKIVNQWNETDQFYPKDQTIHQLFELQADKIPAAIAVEYENQRLTYRELNSKANQVAHHIHHYYKKIIQQPFLTDTLIGISADRSLEMIIGILGILKAGGAYTPIDPGYPKNRVEYILENT